jgi:rubrerythrin
MSEKFNAKEIFEIAEQIERNGSKFYRNAENKYEKEGIKNLLLELAEMEDDHEKTFQHMKNEYLKNEQDYDYYDPDNESAAYMAALANGYVFDLKADPVALLSRTHDIKDVLRKAIELERDSIIFYLGVREIVPADLGRDKIDEIIDEEKKHIVLLTDKLKSFN